MQDIKNRRDLPRLPRLTRQLLVAQFDTLQPQELPPGEEIFGVSRSSGSTGQPTAVAVTAQSNLMFSYLNQRYHRWFRHDPARTLATIRLGDKIPQLPDGRLAEMDTLRTDRWAYSGLFFETGPGIYFNVTNPVEAQLEWLRRERPDYLLTRSHSFEHLAMAAAGERPCPSLRGLTAISEVLTPATRRHLEAVYGAPLRDGYGLNEIGMVAARCEGGRYHVHREHCIVEIVDEAGIPVPAGRAGRLLVTGLQNAAMPLLRYDTDDLVTALDGACACGRTLPSFGEIHGRCSRIASLPAGTLERVGALRTALQETWAGTGRNLRRYQIQQFRDGRFELRVLAAATMPEAFHEHVAHAWSFAVGPAGPTLAIREVADIPLDTAIYKYYDFVSEFEDSGSTV